MRCQSSEIKMITTAIINLIKEGRHDILCSRIRKENKSFSQIHKSSVSARYRTSQERIGTSSNIDYKKVPLSLCAFRTICPMLLRMVHQGKTKRWVVKSSRENGENWNEKQILHTLLKRRNIFRTFEFFRAIIQLYSSNVRRSLFLEQNVLKYF